MHDELWMEVHDTVQETGIKIIAKGKKMQKANGVGGGQSKSYE